MNLNNLTWIALIACLMVTFYKNYYTYKQNTVKVEQFRNIECCLDIIFYTLLITNILQHFNILK